jgi:hypothetical protein
VEARTARWVQGVIIAVAVLVIAVAAFAVVSNLRGDKGNEPAATPQVSDPTDAPAPAPVETEVPAPVDPLEGLFPKGYPKRVPVASIPEPINSEYEGDRFAVQLAPGVYTALPPGSTVQDAALSDVMDGFCASITAYSRKFRGGEEFGGSCW